MNPKNKIVKTGLPRFTVMCETGLIYLSQENRYPEKGEVIELTEERASLLLSANLIARVEMTEAPQDESRFEKE